MPRKHEMTIVYDHQVYTSHQWTFEDLEHAIGAQQADPGQPRRVVIEVYFDDEDGTDG